MGLVKPMRNPDITMKDIGDETLLYSADQKVLHILNPTAKLIWHLCDGEHSVSDIEEALRLNFSVPAEHDVAADVQKTLEVFVGKSLLQNMS